MNKKVKIAIIAVLAVAIVAMATRMIVTVFPKKADKVDTEAGVEYIVSRESEDVSAEQQTLEVEDTTAADESATAESTTRAEIPDGNYKAAFKDILIAGDSLVKAIYEFSILDSSQVIAEIGAGTKYLGEISDQIIEENPKVLVLHFGENELDSKENAPAFIERYKSRIQYLQEQLPNTVIYVDSIFPVTEKGNRVEPVTVHIDYYNELLKQMAAELNVHYLDFTPQFAAYEKEYHDADGIHMLASFYKEQYLPYVYAEVKSNP